VLLKLVNLATEVSAVTVPDLQVLVNSRESTKFAARELDPVTRDPDVMLATNATPTSSERRAFHALLPLKSRVFATVPLAKRPSLPPLAKLLVKCFRTFFINS